MNKLKIAFSILIAVIGIPSILLYAFYDSWMGVIGFGIALLVLLIDKEIFKNQYKANEEKFRDSNKKLISVIYPILLIIFIIVLIMNLGFAIYYFYISKIKQGIFLLEIVILLIFSVKDM